MTRIAVIGSKDWDDYNTVMRKLTIELEDWAYEYPDTDKLVFVHTGSWGAENMVTEWVGRVETLLKQKGRIVKDMVFYADKDKNRDIELLNSGIDKVLIFQKGACKRSIQFAKIAEAHFIPTTIVRD